MGDRAGAAAGVFIRQYGTAHRVPAVYFGITRRPFWLAQLGRCVALSEERYRRSERARRGRNETAVYQRILFKYQWSWGWGITPPRTPKVRNIDLNVNLQMAA